MKLENDVKPLSTVTPARVAAFVAYLMASAYPGVPPVARAIVVGAVTGLYILGVAAVEVAERKHQPVQPSESVGASPRTTHIKTEVKEIR